MKVRFFTLLEVIVASGIMAVFVIIIMTFLGDAKLRTILSKNNSHYSRMLTQAVEYYMIDPKAKEIPEEFWPYKNFKTECSFAEVEDLPKNVDVRKNDLKLVRMTVKIMKDSETVASAGVDRIMNIRD